MAVRQRWKVEVEIKVECQEKYHLHLRGWFFWMWFGIRRRFQARPSSARIRTTVMLYCLIISRHFTCKNTLWRTSWLGRVFDVEKALRRNPGHEKNDPCFVFISSIVRLLLPERATHWSIHACCYNTHRLLHAEILSALRANSRDSSLLTAALPLVVASTSRGLCVAQSLL